VQCGTLFAPRREHARFCSAKCRVAWNRHNAISPTSGEGALGWSIVAMRETTDRLLRATGWDEPHALAVITEAVWWVTMVDATLVRYHPDSYAATLGRHEAADRPAIEGTFAGLRFVRNQMGYGTGIDEFLQSRPGAGAGRVAAWRWKSACPPALSSLAPRGQEWEMNRYRAYEAELAGHPIGDSFGRAAAFLGQARDGGAVPAHRSTQHLPGHSRI
jgi:hypothetical protein